MEPTAPGAPAAAEAEHRRGLSTTVVVVLGIFAYVWYCTVFGVALPWLDWSVWGVLNVFVLSANAAGGLVAYLCAVFGSAGDVPEDYAAPEDALERGLVEVKRKGGGARVCAKCGGLPKPPRAHHCRVCRRCVLRMDHHCVWINNCVGHGNYKAFLLFLLYSWLALAHALGLQLGFGLWRTHHKHARHNALRRSRELGLAAPVSRAARQHEPGSGLFWALAQVTCTGLTLPLVLALGSLLFWNLYLLAVNKTTIEYHEGVRAAAALEAEQQERERQGGEGDEGKAAPPPAPARALAEHPYDLGVCNNLHESLGQAPMCWLVLDRCAAAGDGVSFEVADGASEARGGGG